MLLAEITLRWSLSEDNLHLVRAIVTLGRGRAHVASSRRNISRGYLSMPGLVARLIDCDVVESRGCILNKARLTRQQ